MPSVPSEAFLIVICQLGLSSQVKYVQATVLTIYLSSMAERIFSRQQRILKNRFWFSFVKLLHITYDCIFIGHKGCPKD